MNYFREVLDMVKQEILQGRTVKAVPSGLTELCNILNEASSEATKLKLIFETTMDTRGMSMHSSTKIDIDYINVCFRNNILVIDLNDSEFSMAIDDRCNIEIQRPQPGMKCRIFFEDYKMWLILV